MWMPVLGYEGLYEVSDDGQVRKTDGFILSQSLATGGYRKVELRRDGTPRTRTVHSLVIEAFIGPRPLGLVTRHLDGDPANSMLSNLKYGTYVENEQDKAKHGRVPHPTECPKGHSYDETNTGYGKGGRYCRDCARNKYREKHGITPDRYRKRVRNVRPN